MKIEFERQENIAVQQKVQRYVKCIEQLYTKITAKTWLVEENLFL